MLETGFIALSLILFGFRARRLFPNLLKRVIGWLISAGFFAVVAGVIAILPGSHGWQTFSLAYLALCLTIVLLF